MTLAERFARNLMIRQAVRKIGEGIDALGLDDLKYLIDNDCDLTNRYLGGMKPENRANAKQQLGMLLEMGITPDEIWDQMARQRPELVVLLEGKEAWVKREMDKLTAFIKG